MDTILGIPPGKSYSGIRALADLSVWVKYTNTPYILGHVVDHRCDTPIESFVVHSLNIGQVGSSYEGRQALFLIFLSNIPYV